MIKSVRITLALALLAAFIASLTGCTPVKPSADSSDQPSIPIEKTADAAVLKTAVENLESEDASIREKAVYDLARMGDAASTTVGELEYLFNNDDDPYVRIAAIRALSRIDPGGTTFKSVLKNCLADENPELRLAALQVMDSLCISVGVINRMISKKRGEAAGEEEYMDPGDRFDSDLFFSDEFKPLITEMLNDANYDTRIHAAKLMTHRQYKGDKQLPVLLEASNDPAYSYWAIDAVAAFGQEAAEAVPILMEIIKAEQDEPAMFEILTEAEPGADFLELLGTRWPDSTLLHLLSKRNPDKVELKDNLIAYLALSWDNGWEETMLIVNYYRIPKVRAIHALTAISSGDEVIQVLLDAVQDENPDISTAAITALSNFGAKPDVVVPKIIELLGAANQPYIYIVEMDLLRALDNYGAAGAEAVPCLAELLDKDDSTLRGYAIKILGNIGPAAKEVLPALREIAATYKPNIPGSDYNSLAAAQAIFKIEALRGREKEYYLGLLRDEDPLNRAAAVEVLREFGVETILDIAGALGDDYEIVVTSARISLHEILNQTENAGPYILKAMEDDRIYVRQWAVDSIYKWSNTLDNIRQMGLNIDDVVDALITLLETTELQPYNPGRDVGTSSHESRLAVACVKALRRIKPDTDKVIPALAEILGKGNRELQSETVSYLGEIGPKAAPAVSLLADMLGNPTFDFTHEKIAYFLGQIGPAAKDAVPALIETLDSNDDGLRWNAATSLGLIGFPGDDVLNALQKTADNDPNNEVRKAAQDAIEILK